MQGSGKIPLDTYCHFPHTFPIFRSSGICRNTVECCGPQGASCLVCNMAYKHRAVQSPGIPGGVSKFLCKRPKSSTAYGRIGIAPRSTIPGILEICTVQRRRQEFRRHTDARKDCKFVVELVMAQTQRVSQDQLAVQAGDCEGTHHDILGHLLSDQTQCPGNHGSPRGGGC